MKICWPLKEKMIATIVAFAQLCKTKRVFGFENMFIFILVLYAVFLLLSVYQNVSIKETVSQQTSILSVNWAWFKKASIFSHMDMVSWRFLHLKDQKFLRALLSQIFFVMKTKPSTHVSSDWNYVLGIQLQKS